MAEAGLTLVEEYDYGVVLCLEMSRAQYSTEKDTVSALPPDHGMLELQGYFQTFPVHDAWLMDPLFDYSLELQMAKILSVIRLVTIVIGMTGHIARTPSFSSS